MTDTDITVAGLVVHAGRALIVRERARGRVVVNLPGGHIEARESPEEALVREVLEETGQVFIPEYLLGCYLWHDAARKRRYLRIVYAGQVDTSRPPAAIDDVNVVESTWESVVELLENPEEHRYPIVHESLRDFQLGRRMPQGPLGSEMPLAQQLEAVVTHARQL